MNAKEFLPQLLLSAAFADSSRSRKPQRPSSIVRVVSSVLAILTPIGIGCVFTMISSCSGDDYTYPSVKREFLTASLGQSGTPSTILTDDGDLYDVLTDGSGITSTPDSTIRVVGYYEELTDGDSQDVTGVHLYACTKAIASLPKLAEDFEEGVSTKPAAIRSIWMGLDYLNMVLTVQQTGTHTVAFIEEGFTTDDANGTATLDILLHHAVESDVVDYTKTAYLSVPLASYASDSIAQITVNFSLYTSDDERSTYTFTYLPE